MCSPTNCKKCSKTTWAGCGQHVAQVKAMVPNSQWCNGHDNEPAAPGEGRFFSKMFGR